MPTGELQIKSICEKREVCLCNRCGALFDYSSQKAVKGQFESRDGGYLLYLAFDCVKNARNVKIHKFSGVKTALKRKGKKELTVL